LPFKTGKFFFEYHMKILIINGPNLNLVGTREPEIYGSITFENYLQTLKSAYPTIDVSYFQSNIEGEIVTQIQKTQTLFNALVINPGGYAHTSVAIADALAFLSIPVIEVHISNVFAREDYRKNMITASKCKGCISGLGLYAYHLAIEAIINI